MFYNMYKNLHRSAMGRTINAYCKGKGELLIQNGPDVRHVIKHEGHMLYNMSNIQNQTYTKIQT